MVWHLGAVQATAAATKAEIVLFVRRRSLADQWLMGPEGGQQIVWLDRGGEKRLTLWRLFRLFRNTRLDAVMVLHQSWRYAAAAALAGVRVRLGPGTNCRQRWFLTQKHFLAPAMKDVHPTERAATLLQLLGIADDLPLPRLSTDAKTEGIITQRLVGAPRPWAALIIGSSEVKKQWGAAGFIGLGKALSERGYRSLFIIGGTAEQMLADEICEALADDPQIAIRPLINQPLPEIIALLSLANCVIGNDTGLLNIAAATGTPTIGLFGASQPIKLFPNLISLIPDNQNYGMEHIHLTAVMNALAPFA